MGLIQDIIENKMKFADDYANRKWYKKSVYCYCRAYAVALEYLGIVDKDAQKKNIIIKKFLLDEESISSKYYSKVDKIVSEQVAIINKAIRKLLQDKEDSSYIENQMFEHRYAFAPVAVYEFEVAESI